MAIKKKIVKSVKVTNKNLPPTRSLNSPEVQELINRRAKRVQELIKEIEKAQVVTQDLLLKELNF